MAKNHRQSGNRYPAGYPAERSDRNAGGVRQTQQALIRGERLSDEELRMLSSLVEVKINSMACEAEISPYAAESRRKWRGILGWLSRLAGG